MAKKPIPLCFRCENRAVYLEEGFAPRCECKVSNESTYGCYAYKPIRPLWVKKAYKDPRPICMGVLGSRVAGVRVADGKYKLITKK